MTSRDLFSLEHGDTGVALLPCPNDEHMLNTCHVCVGSGITEDYDGDVPCSRCGGYGHFHEANGSTSVEADKVNGQGASVYSDRDKSEAPRTSSPPKGQSETRSAEAIVPDMRVRKLVALSRWERAGMLAYIAATHPEVFDETFAALGLAEP